MVSATFKEYDMIKLQLKAIVSDFESGLIAAVKEFPPLFQDVVHRGCYFHYCQAILSNVKLNGLAPMYKEKGPFYDGVRKLLALGLVPAADKEAYFQAIAEAGITDGHVLGFTLAYFYPTWMKNTKMEVCINCRKLGLSCGELTILLILIVIDVGLV